MSNSQDRCSLLRPEGTDLSNASSSVATPAASAMPHARQGHRRKTTNEYIDLAFSMPENEQDGSQSTSPLQLNQGLGITGVSRPVSIPRVPVGSKRSPQTSSPENTFQSTPGTTPTSKSTPHTPGSQKHELSDYTNGDYQGGSTPMHEGSGSRSAHLRNVSFPDTLVERFIMEEDTTRLEHLGSSTVYNRPSEPGCTTKYDIHAGRGSYLAVMLLILSIYSTVMSGLWLLTASIQPRWGRQISSGGTLTPSTASLLSALFAKTIELSFVTVFVGFLGQALSRRSLIWHSRGVTIAEMSMRTWVIQPGFMLTHWQTLRYAGWTLLGVLSFIAAIAAMLYTTASDALVSPKLKFGRWEDRTMEGLVQASYANPIFVESTCQTPISKEMDPIYSGQTCLAIEHAGRAYDNYITWIETWAALNANGSGESTNILDRPQGVAMLFDNTTVQGSWILPSNMSADNERFKRIIANISMAMPHAGIFAAARDPKNGIIQPNELDGVGGYSIRAAVPSPSVNVMCVNMEGDELAPLVYTTWPNAITNNSDLPGQRIPWEGWQGDVPTAGSDETWLNSTAVDDIFYWGEKYARRPPVFPMFPIDFNTIVNVSTYEGDSAYLLAKSPQFDNYTLCSMRSFLYPNCSTQHDVSGTTGGSLRSNCEDPNDKHTYALSVPDSPILLSRDWVNIASSWATAVSLNDGIVNGNASNARLLSQLVPTDPHLPFLQPSIAEALAVLSGCTLLLSITSSAFVHYWQYQSSILNPGEYQTINASVMTQEYASGYASSWQASFYPILVLVFCLNVFCLVYFILCSGLVTDYTEPQNLFTLAINSPPSEGLAGSCGAGPEKGQFLIDWFVKMEDSTHYFIQEGEAWRRKRMRDRARASWHQVMPGQSSLNQGYRSWYSKLSNKTWSWL